MGYLAIVQLIISLWPIVKEIIDEVIKLIKTIKEKEKAGATPDDLSIEKAAARETLVNGLVEKGKSEGDARLAVELALKAAKKLVK